MENFIQTWTNKKTQVQKQNKKFVKKLQQHKGKHLDKFATDLHHKVFENIDCLDCANCCKGIPPIVNKTDSARIAKKLGLSITQFEEDFLRIDEDNDTVMKLSPCPFLLEDNKCSIYDFRPKACQEYPHTDTVFSKNLKYHATNTLHCPATFHIIEKLKKNIPL